MTLRNDSGAMNGAAKWLMGIVAVLFTAMAVASVTVPWQFVSQRIDSGERRDAEISASVDALREKSAHQESRLERIGVDIQYIKSGIDELKRKP